MNARRALSYLRDEYNEVGDSADVVDVRGTPVVARELGELFRVNDWESRVVTPMGAALLVRLYEAGSLNLFGATQGAVDESLRTYIASEPGAAERAFKERLKHPENFDESEFSASLLNALFWAQASDKRLNVLTVGGVVVHKTLASTKSNSGKTKYWQATYSWTGKDGQHREVTHGGLPTNRRNDADRNWGLGPE